MGEVRAADVIRELLWKVIRESNLTEEELSRWLEGWYAARATEMRIDAAEPAKSTPKSTPKRVEKVHPEGVESTPESTPADGVQNGPRKGPWAAYRSNVQSRLLMTQFSTEQIAKASDRGVTVEQIRAFADDVEAIPTAAVSAIFKALEKLEAKP